jgi:hypothetical protein
MGNRNMNGLQNNNGLNLNGEGNEQNLIPAEEQQNQIIQERATTKKILAVRLPVILRKQSLALEEDAVTQNKWYIKFNYDSLVNLDCYIYFNVSQKAINHNISNTLKNHNLAYFPSTNLSSKSICIKNLPSGENMKFSNKEAFIDLNYYFSSKLEIVNSFDVCIEFVPIFPPKSPELADNNEIVFVSLCNFEKHRDDNSYVIRCALQRLRTHNFWIDFHDIFDSALEGGLCLVCCSAIRNTIFLPCKHAGFCDKCGSEIKLRFKPCPICKTPIDDLLIIDSDEKKIDGDIIESDISSSNNNNILPDMSHSENNNENDIIINVNERNDNALPENEINPNNNNDNNNNINNDNNNNTSNDINNNINNDINNNINNDINNNINNDINNNDINNNIEENDKLLKST